MISNSGGRIGGGKSGNKAACSECGNNDRFKSRCPIWIQNKKKRTGARPTTNVKWEGPEGQKGKGHGVAIHFSCLKSEEMDPRNEELPANEVNYSSRFTNLANVLEAWGLGEKEPGQRMF